MRHAIHIIILAGLSAGCATGTIKLGDDTGGGSTATTSTATTSPATVDGGSGTDGGGSDGGGSDGGGSDGGGSDGGATDGGATDGGATDGGGTDGGTPDGGATDGGTTSAIDWSGIYHGSLDIIATGSWGTYDLGSCDTIVTVDTFGTLFGASSCDAGGWGGPIEVPIEGIVADDGQVTASATLDLGWGSAAILDVSGDIDASHLMALTVYGEIDTGWEIATVEGWGDLTRE